MMTRSITETCPEEIATELYHISSRLRILSEFSRSHAFKQVAQDKRKELFNGYALLLEAAKICEDLSQGFLDITI